MRLLEVTHYMTPHAGGIERVASMLVDGLSRRGHDVRWVASACGGVAGTDGARVRLPAWNVLEERLGVPYPILGPGAAWTLADHVRWADVVHVHDCLYMSSALAVGAARERGTATLLTQHIGPHPYAPPLAALQHAAYRTLGRALLGAADRLAAVSPHVPAWFRSLGMRRPFEIVPNAVEPRFRPPTSDERRAARQVWGVSGPAVLFVGRLIPLKGLAQALAAWPDLLVVGDGPERRLLGPRARHIPGVPPERMHELYWASDLLLLPSRGEGFVTLAVQEAMLCGLPVVVSDDPAFRLNLAGAPGVGFGAAPAELALLARRLLDERPSPAGWARARWSHERFLDGYERLLAGLTR